MNYSYTDSIECLDSSERCDYIECMAQLTIRCSDEEAEGFREAAYRERRSLNAWILGRLTVAQQVVDASALAASSTGFRPAGRPVVRELTTERDDDEKF